MKNIFAYLSLSLFAAFAVFASPPKETTKILRFSRLVIPTGRRVAAIRIDIFGARISAFPKIPEDWQISLELEGSYRARIQGEAQHGVGGLDTKKELDGIIAAATDNWKAVRIEGIVFVTKDFDTLEEIKIDSFTVEFTEPNRVAGGN